MLSFKQWKLFHIREALISTRVPKSIDHSDSSLHPDYSTLKNSESGSPERQKYEQNISVLQTPSMYPDFSSRVRGMSPDEAGEHIVNHLKTNILALHDNLDEDTRQKSKVWYDSANRLASESADRHGIHSATASGVYAALSPQKNWDENISLGNRLMDIYHNKQNSNWTPEMESKSKELGSKSENIQNMISDIRGKKLSEIERPEHKAAWIRIHDEAHNSRYHPKWNPDGTKTGAYGKTTAWGSISEISKAVRILDNFHNPASESERDRGVFRPSTLTIPNYNHNKEPVHPEHLANISRILGENHKVRTFFNNIADPNSESGISTIDTHAVAGAHMMPYGSKALAVSHAFGSTPLKGERPDDWKSMANPGQANHGVIGSNYIYQEAYRRAAAERGGIKPREMQSIAWESARKLFPANVKTSAMPHIKNIWDNHRNGLITQDEAIRQVKGHMATYKTKPDNTVSYDSLPDEDRRQMDILHPQLKRGV